MPQKAFHVLRVDIAERFFHVFFIFVVDTPGYQKTDHELQFDPRSDGKFFGTATSRLKDGANSHIINLT